ncbi:hypothetical protein K466DRAFT_586301 [Polyporus arcularius HHB13444]|uniref:Uncharacterized protein n=1 Tax=Polyporus arcularius HHB13444 TaxID=1314778 RepID=A0A5C3PE49_9APHY|nr:hypothetical protein K466DRAFT_586301 [Polyporus arcularius HHB13444]
MLSLSSLLFSSLVASAFYGAPVSGLAFSARRMNARSSGTGTDPEWMEGNSGVHLSAAPVQLDARLYTDVFADQVNAVRARTVFRRDEAQGPAESQAWFLRDAPWIIIGGGVLLVFIVSALVIWFRGKKYRDIDEPAPEGMQELGRGSAQPIAQTASMKELMTTQGRVTPPRDSQDSADSDDYRDAVRLNVEPGDLMPSRMQQMFVDATTSYNAGHPAITTPPIPAAVSKLPPPTAPSAPSASSPPLASTNLAFASSGPSAVTLPSHATSKTPPIPKLPVPDDKPLPNPYAVRDSRMESVILATPADDHFLHNPYPDSMDGHSPARADSPEPFGSIGPVQPLRVAKKNSTGPHSYARSSTLDKGSGSQNSDLYNLPVLDISSASLALSTSSKSSESSSQNISRA